MEWCITVIGKGNGAYQELMEYHYLCDMIQHQHDSEFHGELVMTACAKVIEHK